ncbi:MAG: MATE family efflux transporter [Clostridia bacterium]|nr:MATE family efflux transporter [Clostridia bacterium]
MTRSVDMINGGLFKKIIVFTIPIMLQGLLQSIYNSADLVVVGQFAGDTELAAVGATTSIYNVLTGLFMGISAGVDVISSFYYGMKDEKSVKKVIDTAVIVAPILGVIVSILGFALAGPVLTIMKTPAGGVLEGATLYLQVLMIGVPFSMLYNFCAAIFRTAGETKKPFIYLVISGLLNVLLNLLLCAVFDMGVVGVAVGTVVSQMVSAILIFINLLTNKGLFSFSFRCIQFSWHKLKRIVAIGIPAGLQSAAFSLSNVFLQSGVNTFGDHAIAGSTAVSTVEGLMWVTLNSFQNATTTFTSQNVAAGKIDRARKTFRYTLIMTGTLGLVLGLGMFFSKEWIMGIFITDNPVAVAYGYQRLKYTFPIYFLAGIMGIMPGAIRGHGSSLPPSLITIFGTCVIRIVWVYTVFQRFHDLSTLYLVHPITWVLTIIALTINYVIVLKRTIKKQKAKEQALATNSI